MTPEFRTWIFRFAHLEWDQEQDKTWICTHLWEWGLAQDKTWICTHQWEWGLAQDNTWICTPVGMGPGTKIASGFSHLDWDLEQVKYLDLHT